MIQANELRIGNYVYYKKDRNYYDIRALCRDRVHPINIVEHDGNIRYAIDCTLEDLQPIPLTPEILESCGAKKEDDYLILDMQIIQLAYDLSEKKITFDLYADFHLEPFEIECNYLHQLQNLYFALTGEELKINLNVATSI